ncbi:hypothetical protein [Actinotalea subterranea]|uniref:hypothetical protein n=1 Tax=Actinotalea subterranea TaxID=2607497 RepID=UPI0011F01BF4|nr:hypothetical protein [Actinotalea subterranea]
MTATERQSPGGTHAVEGPAPGRALALSAWAVSRGAVLTGALVTAQMLRADVYTAAKAVLLVVALLAVLAMLLWAGELRTRAWWTVPDAGRRAPLPARWQVLDGLLDGLLVGALATLLVRHPGLGTVYPGALVAVMLGAFAGVHAIVTFVRQARAGAAAGIVALLLRMLGPGVAMWSGMTAMPSVWLLEQVAVGASVGCFTYAAIVVVRIWASRAPMLAGGS